MRRFLLLGIVFCLVLLPLPAAHAHTSSQASSFDQPLLMVNRCGSGIAGETHFTIVATGDTFPHENIQAVGESQGYDSLFEHIRPYLQAADLGYTNFDGAMLVSSPYSGYPTFNYNPALASALKNAGIDLVSTANNHILDRGPEGIDATLQVLDQAGILHHGAVSQQAAQNAERPNYLLTTLERDGVELKLAFLSLTWGTNGIPDPLGQVNLLWESNSYGQQGQVRQSVLGMVAQAQQEADIVIVAAHWGYEYQFLPDASQIEGARQLTAAGADIILGAQSHTLQPVDIVEANGRQALVIYSLANFIASQGSYQAEYYSATSVLFYIGLVKRPDGSVGVTGYRYLPTLMIDNDTRPAPLPEDQSAVLAHVRKQMRDPNGLRQVPADLQQLGERVEICPVLRFSETPEIAVGGDFAQHLITLGSGTTAYPPEAVRAVWGLPLDTVRSSTTGDCASFTSVLLTERQRLELQPNQPWPYRITGTQLGAAIYQQRYGREPERRIELNNAFAHPLFARFFEQYGGLSVFGYPISDGFEENNGSQRRFVQYFERARFELVPNGDPNDLLKAVELGLLGREFGGIETMCGPEKLPNPNPFLPNDQSSDQVIVDGPNLGLQLGILPRTAGGDLALFNWLLWRMIGVLALVLAALTAYSMLYLHVIAPRQQKRRRRRA
jgi:Putative enzyme of poly-gamma-glutamate biosynthesis (capsule formation)